MSRNVEIKARLDNLEAVRSVIEGLADQGPFELFQDDTFFALRRSCMGERVTGEAPPGAPGIQPPPVSDHHGRVTF